MDVLTALKHSALSLSSSLGVNFFLRQRLKNKLLVLCYHGVVSEDHQEDEYRYRNTVSVREFKRQLETIARTFTPVSGWEIIDWIEGKRNLPSYPIFITFDDGFRNNLTLGAPILLQMGIPAMVSVTTEYIGKTNILWPQEINERVLNWPEKVIPLPGDLSPIEMPQEQESRILIADKIRKLCKGLPISEREKYLKLIRIQERHFSNKADRELYEFLSWNEIRELHHKGINIGSHTVNHPILSQLPKEALQQELLNSKRKIEQELQSDCPWIVYPNGGHADVSPLVFSEASQVGYKVGFTLAGTMNSCIQEPMALDRISIPGHLPDYIFQSRISGLLTVFNHAKKSYL